jgi:hypothetical protein
MDETMLRGTVITTDGRLYTFDDAHWTSDPVPALVFEMADSSGRWENVIPATSISRVALLRGEGK